MTYFKSKHINLRALESSDLELLYNIENNEDYWQISNTIQPFSKDTLRSYLKNAHQDLYTIKQLRLVIDYQNTSIGLVDLFDFEPFHKRIGIGILIKKDFQNHGYAGETLDLMLKYCFEYLDIHQIFAHIATDNDVSLKLFKGKGFKITGTKQDWLKNNSTYKDVHFLQYINNG